METITFTCKVITPMFLAGADGQTPELRAPSIKGAMRFWWRALNGHLVVKKDGRWDYSELKRQEGEIFGGTGEKASRSSFSLQVSFDDSVIWDGVPLVPHDQRKGRQDAFAPKQAFTITLRIPNHDNKIETLRSLMILGSILGGVGKRSRRGMGGFTIDRIAQGERDLDYTKPNKVEALLPLIQKVVGENRFAIQNNTIVNLSSSTPDYPFVKTIEIGRSDSRILEKISRSTHEVKESDYRAYEASLGHASQGRFASPVYVSVIEGNQPVVTTLNTVPNGGDGYKISRNLQDTFKQKIL